MAKPQGTAAAAFSFAAYIRAQHEKELAELNDEDNPCRWEDKATVLSIVRSVVSIERQSYSECALAAHPGGEVQYASFDMKGLASENIPSSPAAITTFFPAAPLLEALMNDSVVRKALEAERPVGPPNKRVPRSLGELVERLEPAAPPDLCVTFPDDLLDRYAFHHLEKQMVAVRVGLPGCGTSRMALTTLGLLVPIPGSLAGPLAAADTRREGFLMKDAKTIAHGRTTFLEFGSSVETVERARNSQP
jgi:hypothetical protein